jgi:Arc/MetJ-type ribon-helix-helix transcriptional regulator
MTKEEGLFSERVGARISPELKTRVQEAIAKQGFDSEADVVRAALWLYVEQNEQVENELNQINQQNEALANTPKPPTIPDEPRHDRIEWALTVIVILVSIVGSKILNAVREEKIKPSDLADEAIQEAVYNWSILWKKLRVARQTSLHLSDHAVTEDTKP